MFSIKRKTTDLTDNDNDNLPTFQKINSLPRNCRLHTSADFTALIGTEYQLNGNWIQVFAKPNHLRYSRLGLKDYFAKHFAITVTVKKVFGYEWIGSYVCAAQLQKRNPYN